MLSYAVFNALLMPCVGFVFDAELVYAIFYFKSQYWGYNTQFCASRCLLLFDYKLIYAVFQVLSHLV